MCIAYFRDLTLNIYIMLKCSEQVSMQPMRSSVSEKHDNRLERSAYDNDSKNKYAQPH